MQSYNDDKKNDEKKKFNDHYPTYKDRPESSTTIIVSAIVSEVVQLQVHTAKSASFTFDIDSKAIIVPIIVPTIVSTIVSIIVSIIVPQSTTSQSLQQSDNNQANINQHLDQNHLTNQHRQNHHLWSIGIA
jgi:phosphate/sulfate permease